MIPSLYEMNLVDNSNLEELDLLIVGAGSDYRAYEVLKKYESSKIKVGKIILLNFIERIANCKDDDNIFSYKKIALPIEKVDCNIKIPSSCLEAILSEKPHSGSRIGIDVSCLTKPYIFFLLKLLSSRFSVASLLAYYTEPQFYIFPKGLFSLFHTSSGPLEILEIPGYTGQENRGAERSLVIILGFDGDLSKEINEDISPVTTTVVNGFPSYSPKFKDISLIANEKLVTDHNISRRYTKANNPFETYNVLDNIKKEGQGNDIFMNIAPLGNKPMSLGVCLFALHNPDVRVVYPLPEKYEQTYTDKAWNSWKYSLPLII